MKTCTKCGETKANSEFGKDRKGKNGLQSQCKACKNAYGKQWYAEHREERAEYNKQWRAEHGEEIAEYARRHYAEHREEYLEYGRQYRIDNPEYTRQYYTEHCEEYSECGRRWRENNREMACAAASRRRARKISAAGDATVEQRQARIDYYGGKCYICGADYEAVDHVIPLAKGGSNWAANLRPICKRCNSSKHAKWPYDFKQASILSHLI